MNPESRHVLIVDDSADLAHGLADLLSVASTRPLTTEVATNGVQALMMAAAKPPDVVLMDIQMPVMGGIDAALGIRSTFLNTPPLLIGMSGNPEHVDSPPRSGPVAFDHILAKPVDLQRLLKLVWTGRERTA